MASESVRAVLNRVWSALQPSEYPCALMGGIALAAWNHPRATRDVDFLIGVDSAHLDSLVDRLREFSCRPKREPPIVAVGELHFAQFLYRNWIVSQTPEEESVAQPMRIPVPQHHPLAKV
jgi:hypothetical protein